MIGYKIIKVYEIYKYEEESGKLFDGYVNTFLKIKQESSSIPKEYLDKHGDVIDKLLEEYICHYEEIEGVKLDRNKIKNNPALQTIAKALLNSL